MSRAGELGALALLSALALAGFLLWEAEGLAIWTGEAFSFCL